MKRLVLDVSNVNPIDGRRLAIASPAALIAKASEGDNFRDALYERHRRLASQQRTVFGSYHFLRVASTGDEADFYLGFAAPRPGDLQPVVDAEDLSAGPEALARRAYDCLAALERRGYRPLLYASSSVWLQLIRFEPGLRRFRVWEADYPGRFTRWLPRLAAFRVRLRHGVSVTLWQFTDAYQVDGHGYDASLLLCKLDRIRIP